ncbi:hypothetical protein MGSAQ_001662 [marine sediment metagenome]|uniref:Uncharacterized protein n=1 Tax=marine sediment metagenome TaxID=412755 RepID=A0A1B6NU08_9ZZZZ
MCASRSQLTPVACLLTSLAPATKSERIAAARSTNTGISRSTPI